VQKFDYGNKVVSQSPVETGQAVAILAKESRHKYYPWFFYPAHAARAARLGFASKKDTH
jgi:hypothetical protein